MANFDNMDGMPPGWQLGPSLMSQSKFHDKVVSDYLRVVRWTQTDTVDLIAQSPAERASDRSMKFTNRLKKLLRAHIRDARIFEIIPEFFIRVDREVDLYTTEQIAGQKHQPNEWLDTPWGRVLKESTIPKEELFQYARAIRKASQEIGVPNPRPFDTMWLGMGSMITLASRMRGLEADGLLSAGIRIIKAPSIVGILMSDDYICEVNTATVSIRGLEEESILIIPVWVDDMWISPELGHPWTLNAIVEVLNQQDTLITETPVIDKRKFSQRRWWQQQQKEVGFKKPTVLPPMYYTVTIKPSTRDEKVKLAMQGARNWTHRWDVRGHKLTKATGGYKPIEPVRRRRLIMRGYTIIEDPEELTDEQAAILTRHKKSFPNNVIWVAIKVGFRKHFIKGPPEKPYIPASWRLKEMKEGKE